MNADELAQAYRHTNGEPIQVNIYCNETSHNGQRYDVYQFGIDEVDSEPTWAGSTRSPDGKGRLKGASGARATLVGDRYVSSEERNRDKTLIYREPIRTRYALACGVCGLKVVRHRIPLVAVLDKLALAGVSEISLAALEARVGK